MLVGKKVATKLRSSQYLPSPLKKVAKLRGYAVVNTSPPPWNVLVGEKWLCGYGRYAVVKPTPPSQNMLVRKEVAMRLRSLGFLRSRVAIFTLYVYSLRQPAFCVSASPRRVATLSKISFGVEGYSAVKQSLLYLTQK